MEQKAEENPVSKYFRKQNGGKSAVELLDNEFSSMYVVGFAEMYHEKRLKELKEKVEKIETHFIGNETVGYKTYVELEDVLELIEEGLD